MKKEVDFFVDFKEGEKNSSIRADKVSAITGGKDVATFIFCVSGQPIMINETVEDVKKKINKKLNELYIEK